MEQVYNRIHVLWGLLNALKEQIKSLPDISAVPENIMAIIYKNELMDLQTSLEAILNHYCLCVLKNEFFEEKLYFDSFNIAIIGFFKNCINLMYKQEEIDKKNKSSSYLTEVKFFRDLRNLLNHFFITTNNFEKFIEHALFINELIKERWEIYKEVGEDYVFNLFKQKNTEVISFGSLKEKKSTCDSDIPFDDEINIWKNPLSEWIHNYHGSYGSAKEMTLSIITFNNIKKDKNLFDDPNCWIIYIEINFNVLRIEMFYLIDLLFDSMLRILKFGKLN